MKDKVKVFCPDALCMHNSHHLEDEDKKGKSFCTIDSGEITLSAWAKFFRCLEKEYC